MKKIVYLFVLAAFVAACSSEPHYVVKGAIDGADSVTFILQKRVESKIVTFDSVFSKKGTFKMDGTVEYPEMIQLVVKNTANRASFFIENSAITITGKLDSLFNAKITGSKTQDEYQSYVDQIKPLSEQYSKIYIDYQGARRANDTAKVSRLEKEADAVSNQMTEMERDFVKNNPASYFTPALLRDLSLNMEPDEIESVINTLDTNVAKVPIIKDIKDKLIAMKAVAIGQKAPDFTLNDVDGNPVSLYSKVGSKLLLVDFWAAWCNPCRQENPNVVKVYNEFHKKGFDVIGVSLDRTKEEWVKAIADDKLTWTHVADPQFGNNAAAKLYVVDFIPANFLLDETGIILARNLRDKELKNKVSEILNKK